jgi:hypothetical protein
MITNYAYPVLDPTFPLQPATGLRTFGSVQTVCDRHLEGVLPNSVSARYEQAACVQLCLPPSLMSNSGRQA